MTGGPEGADPVRPGEAVPPPLVRRVLVVPSPDPTRLARACAGLGVRGLVVPTGAGCAVLLDGDDATAVSRLSRVLGRAPLLLLVRTDGQVGAERWVRGSLASTPRAGLLLASLPDAVTDLLVGTGDTTAVHGAVPIAPHAAGAGPDGPAYDPGRPERRRRADRVSAVAVAVVALLLAVVEGARAATSDGSWVAVGLALLVVAAMAVLAARRAPARAREGAARPEPGGTRPGPAS